MHSHKPICTPSLVFNRSCFISAQNFSSSVDLDWHLTPEGQSVFAHLKDPVLGTRINFGKNE